MLPFIMFRAEKW